MDCSEIVFSGHAFAQMFARNISVAEVEHVVRHGETVQEYPDDSPFPSRLLLGFSRGRPLHVVAAIDTSAGWCIVVTAYVPDPQKWDSEYRERRDR